MSEHGGSWPRGVLEMCVLALLGGGPAHGYGLARHLSAAGVGEVKGGTLYPLLGRLERDRLVESTWEPGEPGRPGRKYYRLTETGRQRLNDDGASWRCWVDDVNALLDDAAVPRENGGTGR